MKKLNVVLLIPLLLALAGFSRGRAPAPEPSPSPSVVASPSPAPSPEPLPSGIPAPKVLVTLGAGASPSMQVGGEDHEYTMAALGYINEAVSSGCLARKVLAYPFKTLERDPSPALKKTENAKALALYYGGAPYALDIRWYTKRFSKVIGYTYFYKDNIQGGPSETRIWTNWNMLGDDPKDAASHWGHETSHQARAGGFGHWTRFDGSFPYVVGDLIAECIKGLP